MVIFTVLAMLVFTGTVFFTPTADQHCPPLPELTVQAVFDRTNRPQVPSTCRTVIHATGDVLLARVPNDRMIKLNNPHWAFENVARDLRRADLVIVNLENPLTPNCQPALVGTIFCGRIENVQALTYAGVDVVNVANNHLGDQKQAGVDSTLQALLSAGLTVTGADSRNLAIREVNGIRFAFLGYNEVDRQPGAAFPDQERVEREVGEARQRVGENGVVIVSLHGGIEYTHQPTPRQRQIAHWAIDAGADLIIGHHPHWIQGVEMYKGKLIMYSLGNFVFDQMKWRKTRVGLMARLTFNGNQLADVEFRPVMIEDYGQPRWMTRDEAAAEIQHLEQLSLELVEK